MSGDAWAQFAAMREQRNERHDRVVGHVDRLHRTMTMLTEEVKRAVAERDAALALLREVRQSGVECDAPGVGYVTVQIDRQTWADLAAALEGRDA